MEEKTKLIEDVIEDFFDELDQRGYGQNTTWSYKKICRSILAWCCKNEFTEFNESAANRYCDENINGHLCNPSESLHYKKTLRVARMLVCLNKGEDFEFRAPRIEYEFKTSIKDHIAGYLSYCTYIKRLFKTTVEGRRLVAFRFDKYLSEQGMELGDVTVEALEAFFSSAYCTKASRHSYKPIIKELYRYLYDNGALDKDYSTLVLKEPKVHLGTKVPSTYTEDEITWMINAIDRSSGKGKRDYLVLLLAAEYGWRASDITLFRLDQIDWEKNRISMVQYKTGVPVEFPLLASVGNAIIDYLKHGRPAGGYDVIIVNHENTHKGQKLESPTIHSIVSKAMSTANIANWKDKKHGPHSLRHSLATNMLKQNVAIPIISTILGHQSTEATKTYIRVDIPKLRLCSLLVPELKSSYFQIIKEATV
jgi:site-specific recombinase XerD